jgi:glycosyltransferase involved in cell wall biosynthesis
MKAYLSLIGLMPRRIGGTEVFSRELSIQLAELGWRSVLCFRGLPQGTVREYLNLPNVSLEAIPSVGPPGLASLPQGIGIFRRHKPAIVHLHYVAMASPWPRLAQAMGIGRVYQTDHTSRPAGHVAERLPAWKRVATQAFTAPLSGMVTVSDYGDRCTRGTGVFPDDRVRRIYNGVDLRATGAGESFRRIHGIPAGAPLVIQVSNMIREKGIDDFLAAARIVLSERPSIRFLLIGAGPAVAEFEQRAQSLGISHAVGFTGLLTDPVRDGAYAAADIVCQVSRWEEVFGFTIAEAMAASRPVIGTNVGGIPELIRDGATGCLVPRGDPTVIADRILRLMADPALRTEMGAAGRASAEAMFDVRDRVRDLLRLTGVVEA